MFDLKVIPRRTYWYWFSGILTGAALVGWIVFGLKQGIDFTGGSLMELQFTKAPEQQAIAEVLQKVEKGEIGALAATAEVKPDTATPPTGAVATPPQGTENTEGGTEIGTPIIQSSGPNTVLVRIKYINDATHRAILEGLKTINDGQPVIEQRFETIGPVIGATLKKNAWISVALASLFIILYIAYAFRKVPKSLSPWRFGIIAVIAMIHDVVITLGVFVLLGKIMGVEIDTLFVTALLTVMGFSVHDTIVVFDRIRERVLLESRNKEFHVIANDAINQTLARSINTSLTVVITLTALFIFGGSSIKWFVFALIIGIAIGTYSSIFLASPLIVTWRKGK